MSIVNLKCSNHYLTLGSTPILASGSQNVDTISVEFDESWDSYGVKEAIFWRATEPNVAYRQIFENYASTAVIPANVLAEKGNIIFCLRGINGDDIITTTVVTLDVVEGVAVEGRDPSVTPSVYDEILKELQNIRLTCGEQIIEQNKKYAIEVWVGTQAEYDALETKPENTLCIITDEIGSKELLEQATAALEEANEISRMINTLWNYSQLMMGTCAIYTLYPDEQSGNECMFSISNNHTYKISIAGAAMYETEKIYGTAELRFIDNTLQAVITSGNLTKEDISISWNGGERTHGYIKNNSNDALYVIVTDTLFGVEISKSDGNADDPIMV